jgi:hypothetical protein
VNGSSDAAAARARFFVMIDLDRRQLLALCAAIPSLIAVSRANGASSAPQAPRDFDAFLGRWQVRHRSLKQRLLGSNDWEEFGGTSHWQSILGGTANFNESVVQRSGATYQSLGLRAYDAKTEAWTDWSLSGRDPTKITVDGVGRFANGIGTFFADDTFADKPIRVRGIFTPLTARSMRWEQAFSADGGRTWETNYVMEHTRLA